MSYFQILDCSTELGTCCSNYALAMSLDTIRKFMNIVQIIAPIILILMAVIGFAQLMMNPEQKNGMKSILNKVFAAAIIFSIPVMVDAVLLVLPDSFSVSACWEQAKTTAEISRATSNKYVDPYSKKRSLVSIIIPSSDYQKSNPSTGNSNDSSQKGKDIVNYAKKFVGQAYLYGGSWNGEEPYTPTDCSGFVQGVYKHFGYNLGRDTDAQWNDDSKYTLVSESDIKAGDLIMYEGHVGILTGNGNEVVHAKGKKYGIVIDSDYKTCSSHAIKGIMRINGVN